MSAVKNKSVALKLFQKKETFGEIRNEKTKKIKKRNDKTEVSGFVSKVEY